MKGKADDKVKITNWRKLSYELRAPQFMAKVLDPVTLPNGKKGFDFPKKMRDFMKAALDDCFVEYSINDSQILPREECKLVVKAKYFEQDGHDRFIANGALNDQEWGTKSPRCVRISLCDRLHDGKSVYHAPVIPMQKRTESFELGKAVQMFTYPANPVTGNPTIDFANSTWEADLTGCKPDHPGRDENGDPRKGVVQSDWVKHVKLNWIELTLPRALVFGVEPGNLVGPPGAKTCPINVTLSANVPKSSLNGLSTRGVARQVCVVNLNSPQSRGATLVHELGHNMGMTVMAGRNQDPDGMPPAKHIDNGGNYYINAKKANFAKGIRTAHQGGHCAEGVPAKAKALPDVGATASKNGGTCILYGSGGDDDAKNKRKGFCQQCKTYIKARNLADVRTTFGPGDRPPQDC